MSLRLPYWSVAPEEYKALMAALPSLKSGLGETLIHLVFIRVSQINGCAFCVDTHTSDAVRGGESQRRLNNIAVWRDAPLFTAMERAALCWAERLTRVGEPGSFDEPYAVVREAFSEKDIVLLTFAVALINALNRVAIGFGRAPSFEG